MTRTSCLKYLPTTPKNPYESRLTQAPNYLVHQYIPIPSARSWSMLDLVQPFASKAFKAYWASRQSHSKSPALELATSDMRSMPHSLGFWSVSSEQKSGHLQTPLQAKSTHRSKSLGRQVARFLGRSTAQRVSKNPTRNKQIRKSRAQN